MSFPAVNNDIDVIEFVWNVDTWSHPNASTRIQGLTEINHTYNIGAQLCTPSQPAGSGGGKADILQIATHGLVFNKKYWDSEVQPERYSYVHAAVNAGYSILTYDRLGTGASDKPDAYNIVQAPLQLEILAQITKAARSGALAAVAKSHFNHSSIPPFSKIVHIGHSFGSILTGGLLARYPELSDGAIETGWLVNAHTGDYNQDSFGWQFAAENDPVRFGKRGSGYMVVGTKSSLQQGFFHAGSFDPKLLTYANSIKDTTTVGEVLSAASIIGLPGANFTGPVQHFLAEDDAVVCGGDCKNTFNITQLQGLFYPKASAVDVYVQPKTGHGLVLHNNATAGYQVMFDWLGRNGL
ncbi:hypothetical protein H2200_006081 [Cladophialophora chaetospira]|uniref:AB hydrolase-1 domain-containing protein n=1 Tax=Cladophialophora chaetospira TaxID=386627 RepID=A0AA38XAY6_9EURO|nr:hypothetical protein H2200_006081 [Cladophialophora chaetospira]